DRQTAVPAYPPGLPAALRSSSSRPSASLPRGFRSHRPPPALHSCGDRTLCTSAPPPPAPAISFLPEQTAQHSPSSSPSQPPVPLRCSLVHPVDPISYALQICFSVLVPS